MQVAATLQTGMQGGTCRSGGGGWRVEFDRIIAAAGVGAGIKLGV